MTCDYWEDIPDIDILLGYIGMILSFFLESSHSGY